MDTHRLTPIIAALAWTLGATACDRSDKSETPPTATTPTANDTTGNGAMAGPTEEAAPAEAPAGEATCMTAAENLVELMRPVLEQQLAQIPEEQRAEAEAQLNAQLDPEVIAAQCEQERPDQKQLECVTNATTLEQAQACQGPPPPAQAPPPGQAPGAATDGGGDTGG